MNEHDFVDLRVRLKRRGRPGERQPQLVWMVVGQRERHGETFWTLETTIAPRVRIERRTGELLLDWELAPAGSLLREPGATLYR